MFDDDGTLLRRYLLIWNSKICPHSVDLFYRIEYLSIIDASKSFDI